MKVIEANRNAIYTVLAHIFDELKVKPLLAEVGVLSGKNAVALYNVFKPEKLYLIDSWSADVCFKDYRLVNKHRSWVDDPSKYASYFGGPIEEQATFDALFAEAQSKFPDKANVEFLRANSLEGVEQLKEKGQKDLHLIYVDANHQYEKVLDDLMYYRELLHPELGCLQLNDCCHSEAGTRQNLGVLEAANKFCKLADFVPVLAVNRNFTDVLLAPRSSPMVKNINIVVEASDVVYVEVPNELFANLSVKVGKRPNLSFM
jgi:Methyltransferase domain